MFIYFIYIKVQEEDRTMFDYGSRYKTNCFIPTMPRTPMARGGGITNVFMMGGMAPSHCHCGENAAGIGMLAGLGAGILAGIFGRKQQTVVQYTPTGGYSGGGGYMQQPQTLSSTQQCTNLNTLYGAKGYKIVDNGDGTFTATKDGQNVGRGSYDEMQKTLGGNNDKAISTTDDTTTNKPTTGTTDGKTTGSTTGTTTPKGTTTTQTTDGKGNVKPVEDDEDENAKKDGVKDSDKNKTTTDNTNNNKKAAATTDTKDGTVDDTNNDDGNKNGTTTNGSSNTKGTGSTGKTRGTGSASGAKKSGNTQPTKYTSSAGRTAQKGADGKWHYYAKDGTELKEDFISKNDPELWAKANPKYASKKASIHTAKTGAYITRDDQKRLHYFDEKGKAVTEKEFKGAHNKINTTSIKQGEYSSKHPRIVDKKTGRWAERGKDGTWHYYATDGTELKKDYVQRVNPALTNGVTKYGK